MGNRTYDCRSWYRVEESTEMVASTLHRTIFAVQNAKCLFTNINYRVEESTEMVASTLHRTIFAVQNAKCLFTNINGPERRLLSRSLLALSYARDAHTQILNKNIQFISNDNVKLKVDPKSMKLNQRLNKPLCIIMNWMLARPSHVMKYAKIYLEQDYDVINVSCSPLQMMFPVKGSQVIAKDMLRFLESNQDFGPLVVHGFSVGAYVWAEMLVHAENNKERYQPILDRVAAQIWDSPADVYEIPVGLPLAVFPNNKVMQKVLGAYSIFHMNLFNKVATKHYLRATQVYHSTPCRAPGLFLCSLTDPVGAAKRSRHAHDSWVAMGIKCNWKCWEKSPHVQHYLHHPEEYLTALYSHLNECGLLQNSERHEKLSMRL